MTIPQSLKSSLRLGAAALALSPLVTPAPGDAASLSTIATFSGANGAFPSGSLIADSAGNLFGTTRNGGASGVGTVFELVKGSGGYTLSTIASFNSTNGANPEANLIADSTGNLFGTTRQGGASNNGTVFELVKGSGGYTLSTIATFNDTNGKWPVAGLLADSAGNLFGTTRYGGASGNGIVFELVKASGGYTLSTLVSFNGTNGSSPWGGLIADGAGNMFGTTYTGGPFGSGSAAGSGTVFEMVKGSGGYTLSTLATLARPNGADIMAGLVADNAGNLFGTTYFGGTNDLGTVFELVKGSAGYTLSTLVSFNGTNGQNPEASLIVDSAGNLFGTTYNGGASSNGTVFELVKGSGGYTLSTLVSFNGTNGGGPISSLIADSSGNLFGTTFSGGPTNAGTVFQITGSGFVPSDPPAPVPTPSGLSLFGAGLLGLGFVRHRAARRLAAAELLED
jgi:hypothetical protein